MKNASEHRVLVALCGVLLGCALLDQSGADSNQWLPAGGAYVVVAAVSLHRELVSEWRRFVPLLILPACIALQLLPWPAHSVAPSLTALELLRVSVYLAVFVSLREVTIERSRWEWRLFAAPLLAGCAEAAFGIFQHASRGLDNYAIGTFQDHSHFAGFMEMLLPISLVLAIEKRHVLAYFAAPMVIFAALLHSFSRMGLAAAALAVVAMVLIFTRRLRWTLAAAGAVIAITLLWAPSGLGARFERIMSYQGFRKDAQLVHWQDTLKLIAARPVFGSGAGAYRVAFAPYNTSTPQHDAGDAANDYLQLLAEIGIAGTVAALALLGVALVRSIQAGRTDLAALGCAGAMIALLAHSVFEFQMYVPANVLTLCWIAGAGCGIYRRQVAT